MAMNHSQKKRLENVWEALKHDKIAIFSIIFLALILILSLLAPVLPLEPNKTDVAHDRFDIVFHPGSPGKPAVRYFILRDRSAYQKDGVIVWQ